MKWLVSLSVSLLLLSAGLVRGQERPPFEDAKQSQQYQKAAQAGRTEADQEWDRGQATIYSFGLRGFENLDQTTGLPFQAIAGCVVDDEILGRAAGHNDRMAELIKQRGLPNYSLKRWEKELFDLHGCFEDATKIAGASRLTQDGPTIKGPEGEYTIRPVAVSYEKDDGRPATLLGLVVATRGAEREPLKVFLDEGVTDLIWGPKGSNFAIVRTRDGEKTNYMALDLARGQWLRGEYHESIPPGSAR